MRKVLSFILNIKKKKKKKKDARSKRNREEVRNWGMQLSGSVLS